MLTSSGGVILYGCMSRSLQVLADFVSLYFVAVTVGAAALVSFIALAPMLDSIDVFPGEQAEMMCSNSQYAWSIVGKTYDTISHGTARQQNYDLSSRSSASKSQQLPSRRIRRWGEAHNKGSIPPPNSLNITHLLYLPTQLSR